MSLQGTSTSAASNAQPYKKRYVQPSLAATGGRRAASVERAHVERVGKQRGPVDDLGRRVVGRGQDHRGRHTGVERLLPARRAQAPAIPGPKPGEPGSWGRQVVASTRRERQKFLGHL